MYGKYSIELCLEGGPDFGIEAELAREESLATALLLSRDIVICADLSPHDSSYKTL